MKVYEWYNPPQYVIVAYNEPHRKYHTIEHIESCLEKIPLFTEAYSTLDEVALSKAIWYHDVVYEPGSSVNEIRSANTYRKEYLWIMDCDEDYRDEIYWSILRTKGHENFWDSTLLEQVVCDIDLADMGYSDGRYAANSVKIKEEFACTDEQWLLGRVKFIEDFLGRPFIYQTPLGYSLWEQTTRENMKLELAYLTGKYGV